MPRFSMRSVLAACLVLGAGAQAVAGGAFTVSQVGPLGNTPYSIIAYDLNGDHRLDLAVTNYYSGTVSLLYGTGAGTFTGRTDYAVGVNPGGVAAGDFNRDGRIDVATTDDYGHALSVLYGQAGGGVGARQDFTADYLCRNVVAADVDGDGRLDLVVPCTNSSAVSIYYGQDAPGIPFAPRLNFATAYNPRCVVVADFNRDGRLDIATTNRGSSGKQQISILYATSNGDYAPHVDFDSGVGDDVEPWGIVAGDFNHDGLLDLAVTNRTLNNVAVLFGLQAGGFGNRLLFPTGPSPTGLVAADFDGDGWLDLAVTDSGGTTVSLLRGLGDGTFAAHEDYVVGSSPFGLAAGDFNGDGKMDLAATYQGGVAILTNVTPEPASLALVALGALAALRRRAQCRK